ncbi:MAG TPA: peptidase S10 [Bryobacteraceae bacterium]
MKRYDRLFALLALAVLPAFVAPGLRGQNTDSENPPPAAQVAAKEDSRQPAILPERASVTHHEMTLDGRPLRYTATAGTLLVDDNAGKHNGSFFYVAYTLDGVTDARTRPVTFLYNGGPGSASLWMHMGSFGPVRIITASPAASGSAPYQLVPNEFSLLDKTDLVFIDAMGTGFSRPVGKGTQKDFSGTDQDVRGFARFITRYVTVNQRWNSPKYLYGESYGTTRSAALVDALENDGMAFNGVILMSTILNYFTRSPGMDNEFIGYLPSYAAIAYHFDKIPNKPANEKAFLQEVRAFARGPYAEALAQGHNLPDAQRDAIAAKLSSYTGLSVQYLKEANLRVTAPRFRKELLRNERLILGRYDARFEGTDLDAAGDGPGYDPSSTGITGAYVSMFNDYLERELKYTSTDTYLQRGPDVNRLWDHSHRPPGGGGGGGGAQPMRDAYVAGDLADAMRKNPHLRVFSANGLFDLATPFFITEFDLSHMELEPKLRANIEFGYYPSGHMIYLNVEALKTLKADLAKFYSKQVTDTTY